MESDSTYRWIILLIFVISQIILSIGAFGWGALAPFLKKAMFLRDSQIGAMSSVFYFAAALSALPGGIIVDRFGVKTGLLLWLALPGASFLLISSLPNNYAFFLVFAAAAGFGYGMGNPVASKGLFLWFDKGIRGTVFGIRQSAVTAGAAIAGIFLVFLSQQTGPFAAIRSTGAMMAAVIVFAAFLYRNPEGKEEDLHSVPGRGSRFHFWNFKFFFSDSPLLLLSAVMALLGLVQGVVVTFFILYLNEKLGASLLAAGSFYFLLMVNGTIGRIFWGVVSDRFFQGRRKPAIMSIAILATSASLILALWPVAWSINLLVPVVVIMGLSSMGWVAIGLVFVTEICEPGQTARAVGLSSTFGWSGVFLGPIGFGILLDCFGYLTAWLALALCCFIAIFLCHLLPNSRQ